MKWISNLATMSGRPHSDTKKRNQHTLRNMGGYLSTEEQKDVDSSQPLGSAQSDVIKEISIELGPNWIGTINSLVDYHKKVAEQISRLEKELSELKETYKHHDEIIITVEHITRTIQKQNCNGSNEETTTKKPDDEERSVHEHDHTTSVEVSLEMNELKRDHRMFKDRIQYQEHLMAHMEREVNKHDGKIKEHEESIKLLKEQHKQRKMNIKTQRVYMKGLTEDFKKYEARIQKIDKEYQKSLERTQKCIPSLPIDRQTTEQKNTGRERKASEKTTPITRNIETPPVQKKTRKYAFVLNKDLTQAFQSLKSEKLGFFNSTADQNYFDEFVDILKENVIGVGMHEYSPTGGISAFDRILVFGTCTLRVESDSNMALDKIPKERRSKVVLVMFHKTAGSKTPEEVYMYTFKHAEVAGELHVPFKLNS